MKKLYLSILFMLFLTGCGKDKYFTCNIDLYNEIQDYQLDAEYKIYYDNSFVTKVEKKEIYISKTQKTLNYFEEYKNLEYKNINSLYGGVTYVVKLNEDKVILNAIIDMNVIDVKKMVKDKYIDKDYVISNKLSTGGIKNIYEEKGAICEEI